MTVSPKVCRAMLLFFVHKPLQSHIAYSLFHVCLIDIYLFAYHSKAKCVMLPLRGISWHFCSVGKYWCYCVCRSLCSYFVYSLHQTSVIDIYSIYTSISINHSLEQRQYLTKTMLDISGIDLTFYTVLFKYLLFMRVQHLLLNNVKYQVPLT